MVKQYWVTFPDGNAKRVSNLAEFCRQHGLTPSGISNTIRDVLPHHKRYRAAYYQDGPKSQYRPPIRPTLEERKERERITRRKYARRWRDENREYAREAVRKSAVPDNKPG